MSTPNPFGFALPHNMLNQPQTPFPNLISPSDGAFSAMPPPATAAPVPGPSPTMGMPAPIMGMSGPRPMIPPGPQMAINRLRGHSPVPPRYGVH